MQGVKTYSFSMSRFHQVDKGDVEASHAEHVADANEEEHRVLEQRVVQHRGKHRLDWVRQSQARAYIRCTSLHILLYGIIKLK